MSSITTHVLDLAHGRPAARVTVLLEYRSADGWTAVGRAATDVDGRARGLLAAGGPVAPGVYRLTFDLATYFEEHGARAFFPEATVVFEVRDGSEHHHVPLLASPYGYTTYRGS